MPEFLAFSAPFGVPATPCPGCHETMTPGRMVEYAPPTFPGGHPADRASHVLWHSSCRIAAGRSAPPCSMCEDRHVLDGACLL